jgi:hypothetical protein
MSVTAKHHISMAFVHPDWHQQGVAAALYDQVLASMKTPPKTIHASLIAQPFLKKGGGLPSKKKNTWSVV